MSQLPEQKPRCGQLTGPYTSHWLPVAAATIMANGSPDTKDIGEVLCQWRVTGPLTWYPAEPADLTLSDINTDRFNPVLTELQGRGMTHIHMFVRQPNSTVS